MKQDRAEYTLKEELTTCHRTTRLQMAYTICRQQWTGIWVGVLSSLFSLTCPIAQKPPLGEVYGMRGGLHFFTFLKPWVLNPFQTHPPTSYDFLLQRKPTRVCSLHPDAQSTSLIGFLGRNIVSVILVKYFNPCLGLGGWWGDSQ